MAGLVAAQFVRLAWLLAVAAGNAARPPSTPAATPIGVWSTGHTGLTADGRVEIDRCGATLCGRVIDARVLHSRPELRDERNHVSAQRSRRVLGLVIINGFRGGPETWTGGEIYDLETGYRSRTATLKLLSPDLLSVKGCISIFCRTKTWTRLR